MFRVEVRMGKIISRRKNRWRGESHRNRLSYATYFMNERILRLGKYKNRLAFFSPSQVCFTACDALSHALKIYRLRGLKGREASIPQFR